MINRSMINYVSNLRFVIQGATEISHQFWPAACRDRIEMWGPCLWIAIHVLRDIFIQSHGLVRWRLGLARFSRGVVYSNWRIATILRAFRILFAFNRCDSNPDKKFIYSEVSNFREASSALKLKRQGWRRTVCYRTWKCCCREKFSSTVSPVGQKACDSFKII